MSERKFSRANSKPLLKPQGGAHFKRTVVASSRTSGDDVGVMMPGSARHVRHARNTSDNASKDSTSTACIDRATDRTTLERQCSRGCVHKTSKHDNTIHTHTDETIKKSRDETIKKSTDEPSRKSKDETFRKSVDEALLRSSTTVSTRDIPVTSSRDRRRSTGFGYKPKVDTVLKDAPVIHSDFEDSDDENKSHSFFDYGKVNDVVDPDEDEKERQTQALMTQYKKMCNIDHVTPCGRFQRQISQPVVDISSSMLGTKEIKGICVSLAGNVHIKDLDLSGNDLCGKGAKYVAEALRENSSVDELAVANCNIDLEGLTALASIFLDMKPMKRLDMAGNKFSQRHAEVISDIIQKNDYIEDLGLSGNEFDDQSGILLGKALVKNVGIKKLDLSWNHLRRDGARSVCLALKHNTTLEELDLSWNGLAEEGCRALGEALPCNHTLRELDISCNRINIFSLNLFLKGLAFNDSLRVLRIDQNPLTTDGAIGLIKTLSVSDCTALTDIHMEDIPINAEFVEAVEELLQTHNVKVYHRDPNREKITPIIRDRTLGDFDPSMILFEYMKQENLRLIDLFRTFDTDGSHGVSKEELKEGFMTINMPLSDDALESLFEKLDVDDNDQIDYDEVKVEYRKTMKTLRATNATVPHNEAAIKNLRQLIKEALKKKRADMVQNAKFTSASRRLSLTAVFEIANAKSKNNTWQNFTVVLLHIHIDGSFITSQAVFIKLISEYKIGYRKAMRKLRRRTDDPNDAEQVSTLKKLVNRALKEKRTDDALVRGYRKRHKERQASLTAVFAIAPEHAEFFEQLQESRDNSED